MNEEVVAGLYHCLMGELEKRAHRPERPLKVSQLYQDLVPYSAVRAALDLELNADYEHALLRLLAGERGLLRLEPPAAREELQREVAQPFPSVGMFRKFAASDVWVSRPEEAATADQPPAAASPPARVTATARGPAAAAARETLQLHFPEPSSEPATEATRGGVECAFCGDSLPSGHRVRYCPFCGADQRLQPCPRCDAVLERTWRYCISCGQDAPQ